MLNANQTINALHALFKIRHHGNTPEVLQVFVELSCHLDQRVRSEAVQLAVGLVEFTRSREGVPMDLLDDQAKALGTALGNGGLTPKPAHLVRKFLALERLDEMPIATKTIFFRCDHGHYFSGEACPWDGWSHPKLRSVLELLERFKSDRVVVTIQGLRDTGVEEAILKRILLVEFGDPERVFGGLNPRQIIANGEVEDCP